MSGAYLDTSALAKWYVNEPGSEAFEAFIRDLPEAVISRLTVAEFRCLLARRRRSGDIDTDYEHAAFARFESNLAAGHLRIHECGDARLADAVALIDRLPAVPLRTLDAIHLALALDAGTEVLATADTIMARAGKEVGLDVRFFGKS